MTRGFHVVGYTKRKNTKLSRLFYESLPIAVQIPFSEQLNNYLTTILSLSFALREP